MIKKNDDIKAIEILKKYYMLQAKGYKEKNILKQFDILDNEYLIPRNYLILNTLYNKQMRKIQNGCKPSYLPKWLKINHCNKRKEACNYHDFLYYISWNRSNSDKLFLKKMNEECNTFFNKLRNYRFYFYVRLFGKTAFNKERKTINDFMKL